MVRPEALEAGAGDGDGDGEGSGSSSKKKAPSKIIRMEQVRGLIEAVGVGTHRAGLRVVVVYPLDALQTEGANALLKTLEEPPADMLFLLVSHAPGRLLPTIRSRCRTLRFDALDEGAMRVVLKRADDSLSPREIDALVRAGQGSPGQALRYAGLNLAEIEEILATLSREGDPDNRRRLALAKSLALKSAKPRYEAFLERAPAFIAQAASAR